jgi:hypothetical protein
MADAEGDRSIARGLTRKPAGRSPKNVGVGPPKFIKRNLLAHTGPTRLARTGARRLHPRAGVAFLRVVPSRPVYRHAVFRQTPHIPLDFYVEALFQKMRPLALGLRARHAPRVIHLAGVTTGARLACFSWCSWYPAGGDPWKGEWMAKNPLIRSLSTVSLEEALAYLDAADGDELTAAFNLARDRNRLDGTTTPPDETEIHHALFLLRRARGLDAPSFDLMRVQLRRRAAA